MLPPPRSQASASKRRLLAGCGLAAFALLALAQPALAQQPAPAQGRATERSMRVQPPAWMPTSPFGQPAVAQARQPRAIVPPPDETRFVPDEVLFELAPDAQADTVLRRYGATMIASRRVELAGTTIIRARLAAGRDVRAVLTQMDSDDAIAGAQPNYTFQLQQETSLRAMPTTASSGQGRAEVPTLRLSDPAATQRSAVAPRRDLPPQYVVEKLRLGEVHKVARGTAIRVAVIDSGADASHPELRGAIAGQFDALGGAFAPHAHGTAMAAAITARAQLQGIAPAARLLAARAFSGEAGGGSANGTSFHIMAAIEWAVAQGARVVNLSFAGPQDRLLTLGLAGLREKGVIAVAAAGNGGPSSPPLYPGADPNVIAVTATDADDRAFPQANRGGYIAVAAPGVDVLVAEPQGRYAFTSGTSVAAAHVSGLVALLLERRPDLDIEDVRRILADSAVDLGQRGRDRTFGAGRVDPAAALARTQPVSVARP